MKDNTLIDIMLICKGWYNKQLYKDKLSAMQAYYDKYYTYGESQVELTKDFALHLFLQPLGEVLNRVVYVRLVKSIDREKDLKS